jgi:LuxR family maltose regulon positive regulatory protein
LEKCFHANLFLIPLDDEGRWYRYHHLFQDLLLNQQSRIPKQDVFELHRRASRWYEEAGMISDSIDHALIATDYTHAVQLLEDHAREMVMQGYLKTVEGWMQAIPSEWQSHNPEQTWLPGCTCCVETTKWLCLTSSKPNRPFGRSTR